MRCLAVLLLAGCTATKSAAGAAYGALLPDRFYVEATENPLDVRDRYGDEDPYALTAGFSWDLAPTEVVVVRDEANAWDLRQAAWARDLVGADPLPAPVPPPDGLSFSADAEGNRSLVVPTAVIVAVLAGLGVAGEALRRRFFRGAPDGGNPDTQAKAPV